MLLKSPSCWIAAPSVPGAWDMVRGRVICQHSSTETPLNAEIAVRLKAVIGFIALAVLLARLRAVAIYSDNDSNVSSDGRGILSWIAW